MFDEKSWTKKQRDNHRHLNVTLVCSNCKNSGYHPGDVDKYQCQRCNRVFEGKRFDQKMIDNCRNNGRSKLECNECVQRLAQQKRNEVQQSPVQVLLPFPSAEVPVGAGLPRSEALARVRREHIGGRPRFLEWAQPAAGVVEEGAGSRCVMPRCPA